MEVGDIIGHLKLNERFIENRKSYWNCTCLLCGKSKAIREDSIKSGKTTSCGCYCKTEEHSKKKQDSHPIESLVGNVYGNLTVLQLSEKRMGKKIMWTCRCSCGKIVDVWSANLKNGNTTTCGDYEEHRKEKLKKVWEENLDDLSGMMFGSWMVEHRDGTSQPTRWICKCQNCGETKSVLGNALKNGQSTSCGCSRYNSSLVGQVIGQWTVKERSFRIRPDGRHCTTYLCKCECGTERYVDETRLLNGTSLGCGCVKSSANKYIANKLSEKNIKFVSEYTYDDLRGPGNRKLRFDFALLDNTSNVVCLIEFQGAQHYTNQEFGKVQRETTDELKRSFCKANHILLYEIKYSDNIDKCLNQIITHYMPIQCQA